MRTHSGQVAIGLQPQDNGSPPSSPSRPLSRRVDGFRNPAGLDYITCERNRLSPDPRRKAMTDIVSQQKRSALMARVKAHHTKPECVLRSLLHQAGFRFRLHRKDLPGCPDLVLPRYSSVILVHGCFWHAHDCARYRLPSTRTDFWSKKARANRERDSKNIADLRNAGWRVSTVWECAISGKGRLSTDELVDTLSEWLRDGSDHVLELRGYQ